MRRSLNLSLSYFVGVSVTCMVGGEISRIRIFAGAI